MTDGRLREEAYGAFAYAYDKALGERFFTAVRHLLDDLLGRYPTPKRTHLDLACGTGLVVDSFRRNGWRSVGVDASVEMLAMARRRTSRAIAGDFRALPLRRKFARITCLYDSLNHLLDRNDLVTTFRSVRSVMDDDSLFLFDVNHPEIYPAVWGISDPFVADGAGYHVEIATTYRSREKMGRATVSGWAEIGGRRVPIHEEHRQRAYSEREIVDALSVAQLVPVEVLDFDPYEERDAVDAPTVKLFFVVRVAHLPQPLTRPSAPLSPLRRSCSGERGNKAGDAHPPREIQARLVAPLPASSGERGAEGRVVRPRAHASRRVKVLSGQTFIDQSRP
jgi:SAM-dependent methyltransferase